MQSSVNVLPHAGFSRSRLLWVLADVVGLFSTNVGFSRNVGLLGPIFSANVVPSRRMLSGPAVYVLGPLHVALPHHHRWLPTSEAQSSMEGLAGRGVNAEGPLGISR